MTSVGLSAGFVVFISFLLVFSVLVPFDRLSWLPISFLLYIVHYKKIACGTLSAWLRELLHIRYLLWKHGDLLLIMPEIHTTIRKRWETESAVLSLLAVKDDGGDVGSSKRHSILPSDCQYLSLATSLPPLRRLCNRRCLSVCLFVSNFVQKNGFVWNFQGRLAMGQWTTD